MSMPTLRALNAVFVDSYSQRGSFHERGELLAGAQGILFDCPLGTAAHSHSVLVWFRDCGVAPEASPKPRWLAKGTCIDDLTLSPSINLDIPYIDSAGVSHEPSCCWHGFIDNGMAK